MINPTPTTPTNPITTQPPYRIRNGKSSFGGPYYPGPTLTCDLSDLADNKIEVKKGEQMDGDTILQVVGLITGAIVIIAMLHFLYKMSKD